jgi:hypothetical protein
MKEDFMLLKIIISRKLLINLEKFAINFITGCNFYKGDELV